MTAPQAIVVASVLLAGGLWLQLPRGGTRGGSAVRASAPQAIAGERRDDSAGGSRNPY